MMMMIVSSLESDASKCLITNVTHDLLEISRCPDCFRNSSERNQCDLWFAKPCFQRHELVFAKQNGFPYWPAKVLSIIKQDKIIKYDVRFFGGQHSRALIDQHNIQAIDSDLNKLNSCSTLALKKALKELHYHQLLRKYASSEFGYNANPQSVNIILDIVSGGSWMMANDVMAINQCHPSSKRRAAMRLKSSKSIKKPRKKRCPSSGDKKSSIPVHEENLMNSLLISSVDEIADTDDEIANKQRSISMNVQCTLVLNDKEDTKNADGQQITINNVFIDDNNHQQNLQQSLVLHSKKNLQKSTEICRPLRIKVKRVKTDDDQSLRLNVDDKQKNSIVDETIQTLNRVGN